MARCICGVPFHPVDAAGRIRDGQGRPAVTVDVHAHVMTPAVDALTRNCPERAGEPQARLRTMGQASVDHNAKVMIPAAMPKLTQLEERLADMDAMGVDVQVVSPSPNQYHYWADRELAAEIVRLQNEDIAGIAARAPARIVGLGAIALQHPELAVEQLRVAVKTLGFRGVEISTTVGGKDLSDPAFNPVWAEAEALGALIFVHPLGCSLGDRLQPHYLSNTVGQPVETAVALSHLIFGGVLDRHPGLKICAAHGGGYLPTYLGRAGHAWSHRPDAKSMAHPPRWYLDKIWFDSLVYEPDCLRMLIDQVGAGQVVIGTDYPFDMGFYDIHPMLAQVPGLTDDERAGILGGNLLRLLGLDPAAFAPADQQETAR